MADRRLSQTLAICRDVVEHLIDSRERITSTQARDLMSVLDQMARRAAALEDKEQQLVEMEAIACDLDLMAARHARTDPAGAQAGNVLRFPVACIRLGEDDGGVA